MSKKLTFENELRKRLLVNTPNLEGDEDSDYEVEVNENEDSPVAALLKRVPNIPISFLPFDNQDISSSSDMKKVPSTDSLSTTKANQKSPKLGSDYHYEKTVVFGRYHSEEMPLGIRKNAILQLPGLSAKSIEWANKNEMVGKSRSDSTVNILDNDNKDQDNLSREGRKRKSGVVQRQDVTSNYTKFRRNLIRYFLDDWLFLAMLGFAMASCSFCVDNLIELLQHGHILMLNQVENSFLLSELQKQTITYVVWTGYCVLLTTTCAIIVHFLGPQAIGSGIPEMKTILRGIFLKEYLSRKTLLSKIIGLTLSLGSGLPIGKEGPFVHIASILANQMSKIVHNKHSIYSNEARRTEMLAAGCAVGVACTFSAPVGGVLFSIEVTSVYFAVRNYWRGFFAAACAATLFRILRVILSDTMLTVVAFYQTSFPRDAFVPIEIALFIMLQRYLVKVVRKLNSISSGFLAKHYWIYPIIISFFISTLTFPKGYGQFIAGEKRFSATLKDFFSNCTYISDYNDTNYCGYEFLQSWQGKNLENNIFLVLVFYQVTFFFLSALASTIPVPSGIFMPVFVIGASFGRTIGEIMALYFPSGIDGHGDILIYPGVYAVVGAAAFCGGVTHTVSVAVIVFELTGQLIYILPVMIAVLIANATCAYLQPSIYDSIIQAKNLPYLPDIPSTSSYFHGIMVQQFMVKNVAYLTQTCTYKEIQDILYRFRKLKSFPIVDGKDSLILLGSCSRQILFNCLENAVGDKARKTEANHRIEQEKIEAARRMKSTKEKAKDIRRSILDITFDPTLPFKKKSKTSISVSGTQKRLFKKQKDVDKYNGINKGNSISDNALDDLPKGKKKNLKKISNATLNESKSRFTVTPVVTNINLQNIDSKKSDSDVASLNLNSDEKLNIENDEQSTTQSRPFFYTNKLENPFLQKNENFVEEESFGGIGSTEGDSKSYLSVDHTHSSDTSRKNSYNIFTINSAKDVYNTISGALRSLQKKGLIAFSRDDFDEKDYDLFGDEKKEWEESQLAKTIDMNNVGIDPAPFQLVEATSLFKVHSLFNLLGLNKAYVTNCGKLVGVVSSRDIRIAIERIQQGILFPSSPGIYVEGNNVEEYNGDTFINDNNNNNKDNNNDSNNYLNTPIVPEILVTNAPEEKSSKLFRRKTTLIRTNSDPCLHDIVSKLKAPSKPRLVRLNSTPCDKRNNDIDKSFEKINYPSIIQYESKDSLMSNKQSGKNNDIAIVIDSDDNNDDDEEPRDGYNTLPGKTLFRF
ncbi:Chloride channel protein 2 [Strongyloides ratti]|uniref:Chloride channel protein 2 n=1 Tax=Strongyloides ratti TaxID=34506 RepID=A0A090N0T8_STRRB|nr:Chloride channel protein 2 [Strongyloides ratti]CEF71263.1 Chloride channel protein 2 [Strongyloides ratti]